PLLTLISSLLIVLHKTMSVPIYTLTLHDALPIYVDVDAERDVVIVIDAGEAFRDQRAVSRIRRRGRVQHRLRGDGLDRIDPGRRSEEHTSELQSREKLVCRLLLEKKNNTTSRLLP